MVTKCIMSKCVFSIDRIAVSGGSASSQCTSTCSFGGEFVQLVGLQVAQMYNSHANRLRARKVRISAGRFVDTHTHTHTHTHTPAHTHTARNKEVTPCCGRFRSQLCPQLLKLNSYVLHSVRNIMAMYSMYCVYVVYAVTKRGTRRVYVGSTYALDVRKFFHKVKGPCWLRACKVEDFLILLILFRLSFPIDPF